MRRVMFGDENETVKEEIEVLLEVYSLDDILDFNDMTQTEALLYLFMDGQIILPEVRPVHGSQE